MFTGLIEDTGVITKTLKNKSGLKLSVQCNIPVEEIHQGDSIAVDGVCLTVTDNTTSGFLCDVSPESLGRTTLGAKKTGEKVNLERALQFSDRLGGHLVTGHVDGIATITTIGRKGDFLEISFTTPENILKYIIDKGSVAVDGISLTVSKCTSSGFKVMVIPHTFSSTTLEYRKVGDRVNLENDMIGKYVEKLLLMRDNTKGSITKEFLERLNFK